MVVISLLCVDQTHRRRGLATRLVQGYLTAAAASDCGAAAVIVSSKYSDRSVPVSQSSDILYTYLRNPISLVRKHSLAIYVYNLIYVLSTYCYFLAKLQL